jgi:DNA-binding transcriptional ArsR family regulator
VSKHLGVLRDAGLVSVERRGRQRMYSVNAGQMKAVHDWIKIFEPLWDTQLTRIKERAERRARGRTGPGS